MLARPLSKDLKEVKENTMKISQGRSIQKAKRKSCKKELDVFEEYQGDQGGCNERGK